VRSSILIVKGKGSKEYILNKVNGYKTLVLLTELEYLRNYRGDNRNIQVGQPYGGLNSDLLLSHDRVVLEPYNKEDFAAYMMENVLLKTFLKSENRKMYVVLENIKASIEENNELKKITWKENGLEISRYMLR